MAITKSDCLLLLTELQENGTDTREQVRTLMSSTNVPLEILRFINERRQLDLTSFYEKVRKSYNDKKSKLYGNIIRINEKEPKDVLATLGSLNLQIMLFAEKANDRQTFFKQARAAEINYVLLKYFKDYDVTACLKLLNIVRADILAIETITNRR